RFASRSTRVPNSLIEDSPGFDVQLGLVLGDQVAVRQNRAWTHGTGHNEPVGIVPSAVEVPAGSTTEITTAALGLLLKAVGEAHCDPDTAKLMMHPHVFAKIVAAENDGARVNDFRDGKLFGLFEI